MPSGGPSSSASSEDRSSASKADMVVSEDDLEPLASSSPPPEARARVRRRGASSLFVGARLALKLDTTPPRRRGGGTSSMDAGGGRAEQTRRAATRRASGVAVERNDATRIALTGGHFAGARGTSVVVAEQARDDVSLLVVDSVSSLRPVRRRIISCAAESTAPLLRAGRRRPRVPRCRTGTTGRISATAATTTGRWASPSRRVRRGAARGRSVRDRTAASRRHRDRITGRRARGARTMIGEATRRIGIPGPRIRRCRT